MPITDLSVLVELYGEVSHLAKNKAITHIDKHCRQFIGLSPFLILATSNGTTLDASPKGDDPGFVQIDDDGHLLIPDWPGNKRIDGLRNLIECPRVGLIFMIPNVSETLRVNGVASIHIDDDLLARFDRKGKRPITVLKVKPEEAFLHCAKAFMRSKLWKPETWPERKALPSMGVMIKDHGNLDGPPMSDADYDKRLSDNLY